MNEKEAASLFIAIAGGAALGAALGGNPGAVCGVILGIAAYVADRRSRKLAAGAAEARHEQKILGECDRVYQSSFTEKLGPNTGDWREDSTDWQATPPARDWIKEVREDVHWSGCQAIFKASLAGWRAAEIERKRREPQQFDLFEARP